MLTKKQRAKMRKDAQYFRELRQKYPGVPLMMYGDLILAVADHLAACEGLLREIGAYCAPIAPGLDPVGLALYERIGPLLMAGEE